LWTPPLTADGVNSFRFRLYSADWDELGEYATIVPNWAHGDDFLLGDGRRFRIIGIVGTDDVVGVLKRDAGGLSPRESVGDEWGSTCEARADDQHAVQGLPVGCLCACGG